MKKSEVKELLIQAYKMGQDSVKAIRVIDRGRAVPFGGSSAEYDMLTKLLPKKAELKGEKNERRN